MSPSNAEAVARFYDRVWSRYVPDIEASRRHLELFFPEEEIRGKTVLDAGCGSGVFSLIFAEKHAERVIGIDISERSLATARELKKQRGTSNAEFRKADLLDLPFPDACFDIVWSWGAVHHTSDPFRALRELMRVVKKGGTVFVTFYKKTRLTFLHELIRGCFAAAPPFTRNAIANFLAIPMCPLIAVFKKREKLRKGEALSELILDWCFTPVRHYFEPEEVRRFLESEGFLIEKFVPASGRFDSTSNFILKAKCLRNVA